jgi:hypothetical protein
MRACYIFISFHLFNNGLLSHQKGICVAQKKSRVLRVYGVDLVNLSACAVAVLQFVGCVDGKLLGVMFFREETGFGV